jgi:small subunit ribosomal protein S18
MIKRTERYRSCLFCENQKEKVDYKNDKQVFRFVDERGKIVDRRRTGLCSLHQKRMVQAIKRARHLALIPFVMENIR